MTMDITKHNWLVTDAQDLPRVVAEAFYVATTGRPGPVLIDVPKDVSNAQMDWYWPESIDELDLPGYHPKMQGDPALVSAAVDLILVGRAPGHLRGRRCAQVAERPRCSGNWPSAPRSRSPPRS